jgi:hypothetical protein
MSAEEKTSIQSKLGAPLSAVGPTPELGTSIGCCKWNEVLLRIQHENLLITRSAGRVYAVHGLTKDEESFLEHSDQSSEIQNRLGVLFDVRRREILRVIEWLRQIGRDPSRLRTHSGGDTLIGKGPRDIAALIEKHKGHPAFTRFKRVEQARRLRVGGVSSASTVPASPGMSVTALAPPKVVGQPAEPAPAQVVVNAPVTPNPPEISLDVLSAADKARRGRGR